MTKRINEIKQAEKGALISIFTYIFLAFIKLAAGYYGKSQALSADGLNNFTDMIASIAVLIGLKVSRKPADNEHRYGHWKAENVASLLTSLIMFAVGVQVVMDGIRSIVDRQMEQPSQLAAYVGLFSASIMYGVYLINKKIAEKNNSQALHAVAKDNFSDMLTSIGTSIAVFAASFKLGWLDTLTAIIIGCIILKTAYEIFKESTFYLSDGFDKDLLTVYKNDILNMDGIMDVVSIRARSLGANVFLDVVVSMNPTLTVENSHQLVDQLETELKEKYDIFDIDVHVEPFYPSK
ncbi:MULTISPECIES: cation diffusion facilitator family transporter [Enterococcaceae]|uniref:cation diffusion facilitator family transporter n=1 Tax=Enterococcaceae TaxID=81852 RepID=UPI000E507C4A|nr:MULTISPECIES: cation diffusion facilitator family transporter [Enterococcaceae]MCI0130625.1 cation diffusion facilitator family transporter [Vagococcus sp. CY53-2]RGI32334.1 cation transporter [Melissococcus sp. OM08-11BH]